MCPVISCIIYLESGKTTLFPGQPRAGWLTQQTVSDDSAEWCTLAVHVCLCVYGGGTQGTRLSDVRFVIYTHSMPLCKCGCMSV